MGEVHPTAEIRRCIAANDRMRIHLHERWQVAYWTRVLEVEEDELRGIVARVGNKTHVVREHLTQMRSGAEAA